MSGPFECDVAVVGYDDAELLDIACVTTTLATATRFLAGSTAPTPSPRPTAPAPATTFACSPPADGR